MTILDTHSELFVILSGVFLAHSSVDVVSLQGRFDGDGTVGRSGAPVCLIIAEKADDEPLWSRLRLRRGTMTLVGDAVTQGVVCNLLSEGVAGGQDLVDGDVVF